MTMRKMPTRRSFLASLLALPVVAKVFGRTPEPAKPKIIGWDGAEYSDQYVTFRMDAPGRPLTYEMLLKAADNIRMAKYQPYRYEMPSRWIK